jgi:hypothetical protein
VQAGHGVVGSPRGVLHQRLELDELAAPQCARVAEPRCVRLCPLLWRRVGRQRRRIDGPPSRIDIRALEVGGWRERSWAYPS